MHTAPTASVDGSTADYDEVVRAIAHYVVHTRIDSDNVVTTAHYTLLDALGCHLASLHEPECVALLGPAVPGTVVPEGMPVPGTSHVVDPVTGAFDLTMGIRWLDYNDTWLAAEWGHPSDNVGAVLAAAHLASNRRVAAGGRPVTVGEALTSLIKSYEIQGVLALGTSLNRVGVDHVLFVEVASTAVATHLLGGSEQQIAAAVSHAWLDAGPLRTYRHLPNVGSRKSWAAGDATARAVQLALRVLAGQDGYRSALTTPTWGFEDVVLDGSPVELGRPLGSYVMENILFKVAYPAEFHAQTALEASIHLHPEVHERLHEIERVEVGTHEAAIRIISKRGPLHNAADRDHCLQYIVAVGLLNGDLHAADYHDEAAADPRIDTLREKTVVHEVESYSRDYLDPDRRSIASDVTVHFTDGTATATTTVEYPLGHPRRRDEALPLLLTKLERHVHEHYEPATARRVLTLLKNRSSLLEAPVSHLLSALS